MVQIIEHTFKTNASLANRKSTTEIILHCAATPEGKDFTVDLIDAMHKQRKFSCIGYLFVIYRDGSIHRGRPELKVGAHCTNHNSKAIGICYIGGCANTPKMPAKDTRTPEQKEALLELTRYLMDKYSIDKNHVYGHYQFANKACPSFKIEPFREEL